MPNRTTTFSKFPWTGGLNTSVDPSLLDPNDLTQADNVIFTTQGTRLKREGIDFDWDNMEVASVTRASSGVNRTITTSGYVWQVGERLTVSGLPAAYNTTAGVVTATDSTQKSVITFTTGTPGKVNWAGHGLTANTAVAFRNSGGLLPVEVAADRVYFVRSVGLNDFELALEPNGTSLAIAGAGTGTHTSRRYLEDIITYTFPGAAALTEGTTADTAGYIVVNESGIAGHDFWTDTGDSKEHVFMGFTSAGRLFSFNLTTGSRTLVYDVGTPYTSLPLDSASIVTFDNRLMVACSGQNNVLKHLFPTNVGGSGVLANVVNEAGYAATPKPSILQIHLGRLWCDDKVNFDRLHYCETGSYNIWQGAGDSGALDVSPGDGDPYGISAIFPPFKGDLFVTKRTKMYRIMGLAPEEFQLTKVTDGVGCVSHQSVTAVDQEDVFFVSDRGVHSLSATSNYGSFSGAYISEAIQGSINTTWNKSAFAQIRSAYVETINSVAFAVPEEGSTAPTSLWFFNVPLKRWYVWPLVSCTSLTVVRDTDKLRLYLGTSTGRVGKTFTGLENDFDTSGAEVGVVMRLKTGRISLDGSLITSKAFKQIGLIYKPTGTYTITMEVKIDNHSVQTLVFNESSGSAVLDLDFFLGYSILGGERVAQSYIQTLDGYGRGITITIIQSGQNEFGEILGFAVFYEPAEWPQETRSGDNN